MYLFFLNLSLVLGKFLREIIVKLKFSKKKVPIWSQGLFLPLIYGLFLLVTPQGSRNKINDNLKQSAVCIVLHFIIFFVKQKKFGPQLFLWSMKQTDLLMSKV